MEENQSYLSNPINLLLNGITRLFKNTQTLAIALLIIPIIAGVIQFIVQTFSQVFGNVVDSGSDASLILVLIGSLLAIVATLLSVFVQTVITGLSALTGSLAIQGHNRTIGEALSEVVDRFWRVFGINFMVGLYTLPYIISIVTLVVVNIAVGAQSPSALYISIPISTVVISFLIVLLVRIALRYSLAQYSVFHEKLGVFNALRRSKQLTKGRLIEFFAVKTLSNFVPIINLALTVGAESILYEQLIQHYASDNNEPLPKPHKGNYIVLYCVIGLIVLVALLAGLALLAFRTNY